MSDFVLDGNWTSLKKRRILITFDGGYADNIINALQLLEKLIEF
jgi:peptidoglycan/xylan/chitin deacetylase (PgdA/CDA1 family)